MISLKKETRLILISTAALIAMFFGTTNLSAEVSPPSPGIGTVEKGHISIEQKSDDAKQIVKGNKVPYVLWMDNNKWELLDKNINPMAEYSFEMKNGNSFAMIIPEEEGVTLDDVPAIIIKGAEMNGVKNAKILETEKKNVNGSDVLFIKWSGDINDNTFVYFVYVYSDDKSTVQVVGYTLEKLLDGIESDIKTFLNGFSMTHSDTNQQKPQNSEEKPKL